MARPLSSPSPRITMPTASCAWPSNARRIVWARLSPPPGRAIRRVVARLEADELLERFFWVVATVPPGYQPRHGSCRAEVRLRACALRPTPTPNARFGVAIVARRPRPVVDGSGGLRPVIAAARGVARGRHLHGHATTARRAEPRRIERAATRPVALGDGPPASAAVLRLPHEDPCSDDLHALA